MGLGAGESFGVGESVGLVAGAGAGAGAEALYKMLNHPVCCIHPSKCCVITCSVSRPVSWDYPLASPVVTLGWECQGGHRTEDKADLDDELPTFLPVPARPCGRSGA